MKRLILVLVSVAAAAAMGLAENQGAPTAVPDSAAVAFDPSVLSALEWRGVGPNRGGRSIAVSSTSSRPHEYYSGATGGGLWKSTDWGITWAPVGDRFWRSSTVGAIGQCEADPDTVYVGFGGGAVPRQHHPWRRRVQVHRRWHLLEAPGTAVQHRPADDRPRPCCIRPIAIGCMSRRWVTRTDRMRSAACSDELSAELDAELAKLRQALERGLPELNRRLQRHRLTPVTIETAGRQPAD